LVAWKWSCGGSSQPARPAGGANAAATLHPVEHGVWYPKVAALIGQHAVSAVVRWGYCTHALQSPLGLTAAG
jgi:hypothetical protein